MNNVKRCWGKYNKSLVQRGSITFWIDKDLLENDKVFEPTKGRPRFKKAILQAGWLLKTVYRLTFRSLEGYFNSLFSLVGSGVQSPHYTLFCKRGNEVKDLLPKLSNRRPMEIVIDASGLKIYGEGEWKTHKHGREKRRRWVKVHVAVDPNTGECIAAKITDEKGGDATQLPDPLKGCPGSVKKCYGDGAYDTTKCRKALQKRGIEDIIPPRKTGVLSKKKELRNRDKALMEIKGLMGDSDLWKILKGYGRRSLVETFFSRLKVILGERLSSRKYDHQTLESLLKIHVLNTMAKVTK